MLETDFVMTDQEAIWSVEEDLRLLEGIRKHGLGNWTDVAGAVAGQGSSGKTDKRCMERYLDGFLGRYGCILPPITLEMITSEHELNTNKNKSAREQENANGMDLLPEDQEKRALKRRATLLCSPGASLGDGEPLSSTPRRSGELGTNTRNGKSRGPCLKDESRFSKGMDHFKRGYQERADMRDREFYSQKAKREERGGDSGDAWANRDRVTIIYGLDCN